jgi:hypothetical protein
MRTWSESIELHLSDWEIGTFVFDSEGRTREQPFRLGPGLSDDATRRATLTGHRVPPEHRFVARKRLGGLHRDDGLARAAA